MATVRGHGGSCCGMFHISGMSSFVYMTVGECRAELSRLIRSWLSTNNRNRVAEITMTDAQCRSMPNLMTAMGNLGFRLVNRFRNSNSGNNVNVFHRIEKSEGAAPYVLGEVEEVVTYRRVYNNGRRSGPYDNREAAERYTGRVGIARIVEDRRLTSDLFA